MTDAEFERLLEGSSLGSPAAQYLRSLTPPDVLVRLRANDPEKKDAVPDFTDKELLQYVRHCLDLEMTPPFHIARQLLELAERLYVLSSPEDPGENQ